MITRHVETLFCDDIRHEVNGKLSFIGVYSGGLFSPTFPVTLPKLCLAIKVITPAADPLRMLKIRVLRDDELLQEIAVAEAELAGASESTDDMTDQQRKDRAITAQFLLVFSPIKFDGPCSLKVRVGTENGELKGLGLTVGRPPEIETD